MVEERLSPVTLLSFKDSENEWKGDPTYEKLFQFWKKLDEDKWCDEQANFFELGDSTLTNNVDQENLSDFVMNINESHDELLNLNNSDVIVCNLSLKITKQNSMNSRETT